MTCAICPLCRTAAGVAKLSVIAAAALQVKLRSELQRASEGSFQRFSQPSVIPSCTEATQQTRIPSRLKPAAMQPSSPDIDPSSTLPDSLFSDGREGYFPIPPQTLCAPLAPLSPITIATPRAMMASMHTPSSAFSASPGPASISSLAASAVPDTLFPLGNDLRLVIASPAGSQANQHLPLGIDDSLSHIAEYVYRSGSPMSAALSPQGGSPMSDDVDPSRLCALCFERVPDVGVGGCEHRLCSHCAETMLGRVTDKPLTCP